MRALLLLLAAPLASAPATQEEGPRTRLDFRISPVVDLHFHVRSALASVSGESHAALEPALAAAREVDRVLGGSPLAWGLVEGYLVDCVSADDIVAALGSMPRALELRGRKLALWEPAQALAKALAQVEPTFAELAEEHGARIRAAHARWVEHVGPRERELIAFHLESLGMRDPGLAIPMYLVTQTPWPGAVTHRHDGDRGVCFVAVDSAPGSQLFETVLHEATHALDLAAGTESVLGDLRARMRAAGIGPRERSRDLAHALLFVQSAESIRRLIDPQHIDYGEAEGVYERLGPVAEAVRGFWGDHLDGKLSRDEALAGMVASVAGKPK